MRKLALLTSLLILTTYFSQAQFLNNVGVKSGVSIANQDWDYSSSNVDLDPEFRTGLYLGLSYEMLKGKYFSMMADLGYVQKGMQTEVELATTANPDESGEMTTIDSRYDYFTVQPVAKFRLPFEHLQPYIFAGPRAELYLTYTTDDKYPFPEIENLPRFNFGASYGAGLDYAFSKFIITLEGQHQLDFNTLYEQSASFGQSALTVKNKAFLVTLGFKYLLN